MRSLLVTGASGFLGWHVCRLLAADWHTTGTYHTHPVALPDVHMLPLDLTDPASIRRGWEQARPDAVMHTAALSKVHDCQQNPLRSEQINVAGAVQLAEYCAAASIPFVFTSTDLVFDGTTPPYAETVQPQPLNLYGQQKAQAEAQILAVYPAATICRLPLLFGAATPTANCFLQGFLAAIAAGKSLNLFTDEVRTPADVDDVACGLQLVLDQGVQGIIHLGGPQRISRYNFGLKMAEVFQFPRDQLIPCLQSAVKLSAPRPQDVSLDSRQAFALGYTPRTVEAALVAIAQRETLPPSPMQTH